MSANAETSVGPLPGMEQLADCRKRIDDVDLKLLALLNERTQIVEEIGRISDYPAGHDQIFLRKHLG